MCRIKILWKISLKLKDLGDFFSILESSLYMILIRVDYEYNNAFHRIDYKFEANHELFLL